MRYISAIVCTYNREQYIGKCIDHLCKQSLHPSKYEIIIVDNNCTDSTQSICKTIIANHPEHSIHYFEEQNAGLSFARNRGIAESKYDVLAFIDDDAFAEPDYLKNILHAMNAFPEVLAAGGKVIPKFEKEKPAWLSHFLMPLVAAFDQGNQTKFLERNTFPIGANMVFRKKAFDSFGTFDTNLGRKKTELGGGEEKDMFNRIASKGIYIHNAVVNHIIPESRLSMDYIKNQSINIGKSERKRLNAQMTKILSKECAKIAATVILFFGYMAVLQPGKATMLIKFRFWVLSGLISTSESWHS